MRLLSGIADFSHTYIIIILHDDTRNDTIPCSMNVEELIHSGVSLLIIFPLLLFILCRKNLRTRKSHLLFLNLLLIHICFNGSVVVSNFLPCSDAEVIVNCSLLISMFFAFVLVNRLLLHTLLIL